MKKYFKYILIRLPYVLIAIINKFALVFSDEQILKLKFFILMGKRLNLSSPKTFSEKLQWLKLNNRKPEYTQMVDKYAVKKYIATTIGEEYVIPTIGIYDSVDDINWDLLPNQFVIKTTHYGGGLGVIICKNKNTLNIEETIMSLKKALKGDLYRTLREWPYKGVPKRIIIEKYMSNNGAELDDYKIHNFNGQPKLILVCQNRFSKSQMIDDFYDESWNLLDMHRPNRKSSTTPLEKPELLSKMLELSKILSHNIPFLRTDFYIIENKIYFGELTFFPASGLSKFEPAKWDLILGDWLNIENVQT